jgi:hypothetical protein
VPLDHVSGLVASLGALRCAVVGAYRTEALAFASPGVFAEERCSCGATVFVAAAELGKQALDAVVAAQVFCEQVSRVDFASNFV